MLAIAATVAIVTQGQTDMNVPIVASATALLPTWPDIDKLIDHQLTKRRDAVLIATKFTFQFRLSQCTSALTARVASVLTAVNHFPGHGCYRATYEPIQARSLSPVKSVRKRLLTNPTCEPTSRLIPI